MKDTIDFETLKNWSTGKINISEDILPKIAKQLNVPLQWLLTEEEYSQQDSEAYILELAKKYSGILKGYHCLNKENQKFVDHYMASILELNQLKKEAERNKKNNK